MCQNNLVMTNKGLCGTILNQLFQDREPLCYARVKMKHLKKTWEMPFNVVNGDSIRDVSNEKGGRSFPLIFHIFIFVCVCVWAPTFLVSPPNFENWC